MQQGSNSPFKFQNQQVEKSIVYELPPNNNTQFNQQYKKKYTMKQQKPHIQNLDRVLCLNCNIHIRKQQLDSHSLSHVNQPSFNLR